MERNTITIPEAAVRLGIGRLTAYNAAKNGTLPTLRLGRRLVVPLPAFEEMLRGTQRGEVKEG